jgi:NAD(P)-dependent dehydrogenase (short-subunit alcohol dehydrogenase family)
VGTHVVAGSRTRGEQLPALEATGQVSFLAVDLSQPDAAEELVAAAAHRRAVSPLPNKSPISSSSWPAIAPETPLDPTIASTAGSHHLVIRLDP